MQQLCWLDHLPSASLEGGIALLKELRWHLTIRESKGTWAVNAGHCTLFLSDSKEAVDAFLYGMALGLAHLPEEMLEDFRKYMLREEGYDPENPPND